MAIAANPLGPFLAAQGKLLSDVRRSLSLMGYVRPRYGIYISPGGCFPGVVSSRSYSCLSTNAGR